MKRKRGLSILILLIVFALAGVAVYMGIYLQNQSTVPASTNALTPTDECTNLTSANPAGTSPSVDMDYCPGNEGIVKVNGGPGKLVVYCTGANNCSGLVEINIKGAPIPFASAGSSTRKAIPLDIQVKDGDTFIMKVKDWDHANPNRATGYDYGMGWISPETGDKCGGVAGSGDTAKLDISALVNKVKADGFIILSKQCWGDTPIRGDSNFDFNDYGIILAYESSATPTPAITDTIAPTSSNCTKLYYCITDTHTCSATSNTYDSQQVFCDGPSGATCAQNLITYLLPSGIHTSGVCYSSQSACSTACVAPTNSPTATPTKTVTPTPTRTGMPAPTITGTIHPSTTPQATLPPKATIIPRTAMIDDKTDTFIIGGLLILFGFGLYVYVNKNSTVKNH